MSNADLVSEIYAAFGRGDTATILDAIATECRWEAWSDNRAQRAGLATMRPRLGPVGVAEFFAAVGELQMHDFQVLDVLGSPRQVVAEVEIEYTTPAGHRLRDQELHLWTFDEHGKVVRMRHYVDTAKHIAAFAWTGEAALADQDGSRLSNDSRGAGRAD
jgi:ketosteroid isomerase-like protein